MNRLRARRLLILATAGLMLSACTNSAETSPQRDQSPTSSSPTSATSPVDPNEVSAADIRATLGAIDPCVLLSQAHQGVHASFAQSPHSCAANFRKRRFILTVGIPLTDELTTTARPLPLGELTGFADQKNCQITIPVGSAHGIKVYGWPCRDFERITDLASGIAATIAAPTPRLFSHNSPDAHTACGLVADAVVDGEFLRDGDERSGNGLNECDIATDIPLNDTNLSLSYQQTPIDELVPFEGYTLVTIAGHHAGINRDEGLCYLRTHLWQTTRPGQEDTFASAVIISPSCRSARRAAASAISAAVHPPDTPAHPARLLTAALTRTAS